MADAQRAGDAATLLPVVAAAVLLPPFILVFAAPVLVGGIPLIVVYVFGVWAAIILCAWLLARSHAQVSASAAASPAGVPSKTEAGSEPPEAG